MWYRSLLGIKRNILVVTVNELRRLAFKIAASKGIEQTVYQENVMTILTSENERNINCTVQFII